MKLILLTTRVAELLKKMLSHWDVYDTSSLMSVVHKTSLVQVMIRMVGLGSRMTQQRELLSDSRFLRTLYTLLLDREASYQLRIDLINTLKVKANCLYRVGHNYRDV